MIRHIDDVSFSGIHWVIDGSWLVVLPDVTEASHRRVWKLFPGFFAITVVVIGWLSIR